MTFMDALSSMENTAETCKMRAEYWTGRADAHYAVNRTEQGDRLKKNAKLWMNLSRELQKEEDAINAEIEKAKATAEKIARDRIASARTTKAAPAKAARKAAPKAAKVTRKAAHVASDDMDEVA